jgi:hypothetical protein
LVRELGELEDRAPEFVDALASEALIKLYKSSLDAAIRQECLQLLKGK